MIKNKKIPSIFVKTLGMIGCAIILSFIFSKVVDNKRVEIVKNNGKTEVLSLEKKELKELNSSIIASQSPESIEVVTAKSDDKGEVEPINMGTFFKNLIKSTGIYAFINYKEDTVNPAGEPTTIFGWQNLIMILVGLIVIYLGAAKGFEPLLLIPIGFGAVFVNIPLAGTWIDPTTGHAGFLKIIYDAGIGNEFFPLIIFMGIGALTDFGPLIANPKTALLGAAAQFGVFATLFGAVALNLVPGISYSLKEACAISIIGGADGPTTIYIAAKLAPHLMGSVAVAAYSYMALVPIIQPPIMRLLTTKKERVIKMKQLRHVGKVEKILFPMVVLALTILLLPSAAPLLGALCFGNFVKESGVVERLSLTLQNELLNIVTIFLGLGVGSQMSADKFMQLSTIGIVLLGLVAFGIATGTGVLVAKLMNLFLKEKINPLIGSAGVSAVPMAARVSNKVGLEYDPSNFLIMHAMGPNVAGVIGTAVAAGVMIAVFMK